MTSLAQEAIIKYKKSFCLECKDRATVICCWKNIDDKTKKQREALEGKEIPYSYHPFCNDCANKLYEKITNKDLWINYPLPVD